MKFDDLVKYVGEFGFYQKAIIATMCLSNIPAAFHQMGQIFFAANVDFWCTTSEFESIDCPSSWNFTKQQCEKEKLSFLMPTEGEGCLRFTNTTTESFLAGDKPTGNWPISRCEHWNYDRTDYKSTIIQEWDLVCEDKTIPAIAQSIFFTAVLVGSMVVGSLSDRYGRKPMWFISIIVQCIAGFAVAFSPNLITYLCLRCVVAACNFGMFTLCYIIGTEWVGPSYRKAVAIYTSIMWATGYMLLAVFAYFFTNWRTLAMVTSLSGGLLLILYPFIPESARWLMTQGRIDEALRAIEKAAKVNGKKLPDLIYDKHNFTVAEDESGTILDLFKTPNMRKKTLIMMYNWFVVACVYYGLSLSTSTLGVNDYIAFWISGIVEIPACLLCMFVVDKFGRRWSLCYTMLIGGVACILTIWTPTGLWKITTAMIGKFSVTFAFALIYLFAAEIFPTPVRVIGVGASSISAIVGGIIAPLLLELSVLWEPLHLLCFGSLSITAGIFTLILPETNGKQLPETLEEGENFGNSKKSACVVSYNEREKSVDEELVELKPSV
ncbi:organic cation transporter protein-like [Antedon mediterranea]|uniref:organic cation transporter protein-like n=1 Tax=Antedon mediterranea TaxID=105859 RepID=UPI003AF8F89D